MEKIVLKNGIAVVLRDACKEDAAQLVEFYNRVAGESNFLSFGKNEFPMSVEDEGPYIENVKASEVDRLLLAFVEDEIIAAASISTGTKRRSRHNGVFGIVIGKTYWGQGLGNMMMENLISWCRSNGVTKRITLVTSENNKVGQKLYEKMGFIVEGVFLKDVCIDGVYTNTISMALTL